MKSSGAALLGREGSRSRKMTVDEFGEAEQPAVGKVKREKVRKNVGED